MFEMVKLSPRMTDLPMTIFASPRGNAPHDVRVKVCLTHGRTMVASNTATVGVRPHPWLAAGYLSPADLKLVGQWIELNEPTLVN